jgi:integrase
MLTTAVQWQLIISNPAERVKPPKMMKKEARYYDVDEVEQMLTLLENEPLKYKVMIYTAVFSGVRLGELSALEWSDIDFDKKTLAVSKQLQHLPKLGTYEIDSTKSESGKRIISIPKSLAGLLKEYKIWQDEEKIKRGDKWTETNKLFTKENGGHIFPDTPSKWFIKFIKRNNLPQLTFHQLRHTNASLLIGQGVDAAAVSKRLGHAKISTTTDIYGHALKPKDREAADKLDNLIEKKK